MSTEDAISYPFSLPPMTIDRMEVALDQSRYMVTLIGQNKRLIISPKLADLLSELKQDKPLEEIASHLSAAWGKAIGSDDLRFIVEQQMIPRGLAYRRGEAPADPKAARARATVVKRPLPLRLAQGRFRWRLLKPPMVSRLCAPLAALYEPLSLMLALLLIVATRVLLYKDFDAHFFNQVVGRATPVEYLISLSVLICVVLFHEFGHAAAQIRFGLRTGPIGFQLYHYIPAFFADVSNSWKLKPRQRITVDIGGIYFQSILASLLYLIYLKTDFLPLLAVVIASDTLCLIAINPFLRFDGYWLVADALAVPNLRQLSERHLGALVKRWMGRPPTQQLATVGKTRGALLAIYAVARNLFWLFLTYEILRRAPHIYRSAAALLKNFLALILRGFEFGDWALLVSSVIRMTLFIFLLLTMISLIFSVAWRVVGLARNVATRLAVRQATAPAAIGNAAQE
jgi:putative peptide zinc metalloprotease protein